MRTRLDEAEKGA